MLELTVHFVKETLYERERSFRKNHLTSLLEIERMKRMGRESMDTREKCGCGCEGTIDKRSHSTEPPVSTYVRSYHGGLPPSLEKF